jgi:hypothetical protein
MYVILNQALREPTGNATLKLLLPETKSMAQTTCHELDLRKQSQNVL